MAMITRWKKLDDEFVTVEGKRILEAMFFTDKNTNDSKLPEVRGWICETHLSASVHLGQDAG
jgi:hypothetical protein